MSSGQKARVAVVMGSQSDWDVMKNASAILSDFGVAHTSQIVSAHRTPEKMIEFARGARDSGIEVIIAGAGGAAHLPGMIASKTILPVLGVPVARESSMLRGIDALLSIVQMPRGIPVPTFAIGAAGASNAALSAISILALQDKDLADALMAFRERQSDEVAQQILE